MGARTVTKGSARPGAHPGLSIELNSAFNLLNFNNKDVKVFRLFGEHLMSLARVITTDWNTLTLMTEDFD